MSHGWSFDRFLRYDELVAWLHAVAEEHPDLVSVDQYGTSHEGRPLLVVAVTNSATGAHETKPAYWVDASIHATELTATVAACVLIERLVTGHRGGDATMLEALDTRTFYVVPRVNPDGAEAALADQPRYLRSSTKAWPWGDVRWPGLERADVDGDGRILSMRLPDPDGGWMPHPEAPQLMIAVPPAGAPAGTPRYRLLHEGDLADYDGWSIPTPANRSGLDLNRNFPAGWSTKVTGSGDHPLSEPEIDALVRAITARPNICGTNAFHTSGGILLRPSSTQPDSALPMFDLWAFTELGDLAKEHTGYPVHSVYEDFTLDRSDLLSGAADDWSYEHLGVFGWTTEFWDVVLAATGEKQSTLFWYHGPTPEQELAVLRWTEEHHPEGFVDWYRFEHPQLGEVELGGWNTLSVWTNPPPHLLWDEVTKHADAAVAHAMTSPRLEILHQQVTALGDDHWRVELGIANTGWLPTDVTRIARRDNLVKPIVASLSGNVLGPATLQLGQLEGRSALRFARGNDGTPDRLLATWTVSGASGTQLAATVTHPRCGTTSRAVTLE